MEYSRKLSLALCAGTLLATAPAGARNNFGETFGATLLGSTLGTTAGTVIGNAMSRPNRTRTVKEVYVTEPEPVKEIIITEPVRRLTRVERKQRRLLAERDDLRTQKAALQRRIRELERELGDVEVALNNVNDSLRALEVQEVRVCEVASPSVVVTKGPEFAEVTV
jgi:vacuolar-type H+-ATPase subunit I/STV1